MSVVHIAIAWLALEKSVRIYCSSSAFYLVHTDNFEETKKQTCAFAKVQRKDPQLGVTTVTVNGFTSVHDCSKGKVVLHVEFAAISIGKGKNKKHLRST